MIAMLIRYVARETGTLMETDSDRTIPMIYTRGHEDDCVHKV